MNASSRRHPRRASSAEPGLSVAAAWDAQKDEQGQRPGQARQDRGHSPHGQSPCERQWNRLIPLYTPALRVWRRLLAPVLGVGPSALIPPHRAIRAPSPAGPRVERAWAENAAAGAVQRLTAKRLLGRVTGHEKDLESRRACSRLPANSVPAMSGMSRPVSSRSMAPGYCSYTRTLGAAAGLQHRVALGAQELGGQPAAAALVFHQQHRWCPGRFRRGGIRRSGQVDRQAGPRARSTVGLNEAARLLDDAVEPRPAPGPCRCPTAWW